MKSVLRNKYARLEEEMKLRPNGEKMQDMINFLQRDFKIGKKATHTQTLKGGMLSLLGIWAESYPDVVHNEGYSAVSELKNMCMHTLETQYSQWDRMVKHKGNPPDWLLRQLRHRQRLPGPVQLARALKIAAAITIAGTFTGRWQLGWLLIPSLAALVYTCCRSRRARS